MYFKYKDTNRLHIKGHKNVDQFTDQKRVDGKYGKKLELPCIPSGNVK